LLVVDESPSAVNLSQKAGQYIRVGKEFANHSSVDHSRDEYAYTDHVTGVTAGVNTAEGFFSIFKRGMTGVYQHQQRRCGASAPRKHPLARGRVLPSLRRS
jgi:ISXO2-like transposase domain